MKQINVSSGDLISLKEPKPFIFATRPGGEIGRRTVFRWQHPKGCAGSNPVPGTTLKSSESLELLYFYFFWYPQCLKFGKRPTLNNIMVLHLKVVLRMPAHFHMDLLRQ